MLQIALGILTAIGGYIDVGSIATAALGGGLFGFQLTWAVMAGTLIVILLTEMCGRLAAVSHHTLADAVRERLGFPYFVVPFFAELIVDIILLAAEIAGVAISLHLATGYDYRWFVPPSALLTWALLWYGSFGLIENGISLLGLVALAFVIGPFIIGTPWKEVALGAVPSLPASDSARYWFIAVSIIGSVLQPFLFNFYASGAVEENWTVKDLRQNRVVATLGMSFGASIEIGVLVLGALVLGMKGIHADSFEQAALTLTAPFGPKGLWLFAAALAITCLATALEVALNLSYLTAQGFGWNWSENLKPHEDARFAAVYTLAIPCAVAVLYVAGDPMQLTMISMALNVLIAPLIVFPLLILMNDRAYLREHRNGVVGNVLVATIILIAFVIAVVAIPLEIAGG